MEQMKKQSELVGTEILNTEVIKVDFKNSIKKVYLDDGNIIETKTVIISTGAQARWLGLENEKKFQGHGLSACATCDGFFFKNKKVAVIGGGNSAAELRAEKILQDRLKNNPKIKFIWNTEVSKFIGDQELKSIELFHKDKNENSELDLDGVFIAIGHVPATKLFHGQVDMDSEGYIITKPDSTETSLIGVYAAGDVKDKVYRQAITAAGMGCMAALEVEKYLS
jgi:thioredoxin reductase (NADPH)